MILKLLGTALTGIGGHYLNKKWDKAILFLCLFIFYGLFCLVALRAYLFSKIVATTGSSEAMFTQFATVAKTIAIIYLSGTVILWLASILTTWLDGRKAQFKNNFLWTKTGMTAAALTTALSLILLGFSILTSVGTIKAKNFPVDHVSVDSESEEETNNFFSYNFYEYVYLGGSPRNTDRLPAPPKGDGLLVGQILYDKEPAEAITLSVILNSKYKVKDIVTDSEGMFKIELPVGDWKINSIQTQSWQKKPDYDKFSLYHGGEAKLQGNRFDPHSRFDSDGRRITINKNEDRIHLNLTIKNDIKLIWPIADQQGIEASIADSIRWEPYPEATKYYIEIKKLRREGTTTYIDQITSRVILDDTVIPISTLKHVQASSSEPSEYAAEIYAFGDDGSLLGKFTDTFQGATFLLGDGYVLIEDEIQDMFAAIEPEDSKAIQEKMEMVTLDRRRIDAAKVLIDEDMILGAKRLMLLVNSENVKGEKEVLSGYIYGLNGNCAKSKEMFDQATKLYSNVCIPQKYRDVCGN